MKIMKPYLHWCNKLFKKVKVNFPIDAGRWRNINGAWNKITFSWCLHFRQIYGFFSSLEQCPRVQSNLCAWTVKMSWIAERGLFSAQTTHFEVMLFWFAKNVILLKHWSRERESIERPTRQPFTVPVAIRAELTEKNPTAPTKIQNVNSP